MVSVLTAPFWAEWTAADIIAVVVAASAVLGYLVVKRSSSRERLLTESVDGGVLAKFAELFERLVQVESDLRAAKLTIDELREEIRGMRKVEEFLEAKIHEREAVIRGLTEELASARRRIDHLEAVCRKAGINGEDWEVV